ncbi:glycosyltransferase protein [Halobacteriovorax sp. BALOs_7]|uniref:Glycosyltransferase n=1 Tax=Halobacteriovorax vibrionivorans TaxID=2152716 RepID=A0ABY0IJD4_9BACT|nr:MULTISPECIES: glycosyltransferase [Halobacteriovorax]AYF43038.1 glycosyltransferase protein [Halobacteriovorax sp. BALOs_7]RZF23065.1 glycosyltransferase [Halobacteriovorax vibrionivorans]TGD49304.1 glycosyltransferase [Halobacteriovorax sp. Y22]
MNHILIGTLEQGGAERQVSYLSREDFIDSVFSFSNSNFYQIPKHKTILSKLHMNKFALLLLAPLFIARIIRKGDTIISFMEMSNIINILTKIFKKHKAVISIRTNLNRFNRGFVRSFFLKLILFLYRYADLVVINSEEGKRILIDLGLSDKKIKVLPNALDLSSVVNLQSKEKVSKRIIFCGRFNKIKNISGLLNVFKALIRKDSEFKLYMIGDGPLRSNIEDFIYENGLSGNITLVGLQKNPFKYFNPGSILLLTSFNEGLPNVLIEALACGLPVISSDCKTGPREIIADKYGVLLPIPISSKEFDQWAIKILETSKNYAEFSKLSLERAEDYELRSIMNKWRLLIT